MRVVSILMIVLNLAVTTLTMLCFWQPLPIVPQLCLLFALMLPFLIMFYLCMYLSSLCKDAEGQMKGRTKLCTALVYNIILALVDFALDAWAVNYSFGDLKNWDEITEEEKIILE